MLGEPGVIANKVSRLSLRGRAEAISVSLPGINCTISIFIRDCHASLRKDRNDEKERISLNIYDRKERISLV